MEFWGVEVKPGEPLKITPEIFKLIHISQAALGEVKDRKGANYVPIHLKVGDKKYVLGTLSAEDRPQLMFDLVFEREFELSHDWKDGSIYFAGYVADDSERFELELVTYGPNDEDIPDEDEDEDNQVDALQNGKLEPELHGVKPATKKNLPVKAKPMEKLSAKLMELNKSESESDEDDDDSDVSKDSDEDEGEYSSELEEDSSDAVADMGLEESMDGDSDDENRDLVSKKAKLVKKRQSDTATEILAPAAKKTKSAAPEKSGGRTPATNGKSKEHNRKSGGQLSRKSKAKHGGK